MTVQTQSRMSQRCVPVCSPFPGGTQSRDLASATAFLLAIDGEDYLATNWHVVAGINPLTGDPLDDSGLRPDTIRVSFAPASQAEVPITRSYPLYDASGSPRWLIHPSLGRDVDAVLLRLPPVEGLPTELQLAPGYGVEQTGARIQVTSEVQVIGFPFGMRATDPYAVWTRGTVATEYEIDADGLPMFYIDARTREGQSGSPVIAYWRSDGLMPSPRGQGLVINLNGHATSQLLGIYAGRLRADSDLGRVFRVSALVDIAQGSRLDCAPQ